MDNCSKVDTINNVLNADAKLKNLHISTLDVSRKNIRSHCIVEKCACKNYVVALKTKSKK